jgi:hypothetical protein
VEGTYLTPYDSRIVKKLSSISIASFALILISNLGIIYLIHSADTRSLLLNVSSILFNLLATFALYIAARRYRILFRRLFFAWGFMALAQFAFTLGDLVWGLFEIRLGLQPFPSIADGFYLLFYLLFSSGSYSYPTSH